MKTITGSLMVGAMALAACGGSSYSSGGGSSASTASTSTSASASASGSAGSGYGGGYSRSSSSNSAASSKAASAAGGAVSLGMYDNYFGSKTITGKPGSTVKVHLTNDGTHVHNFKIDSQKQADADVQPGKSATVLVKIPASGSVQFYCEYHKGLGMTGSVRPT